MSEKAEGLLADEAPIHELDELQGLIAEGQERGFLTIEEITTCLEEVEVTKEQIAELHGHLVDQGIEIVDANGKPVGDEEESEFGHFLTDESEPLPDEAAEVTLRKEALRGILGSLAPRERAVLELRYGLDGQHPRTLDEVGRTFNVTRERIRQIENQSLKKLRALADAQKLREVA